MKEENKTYEGRIFNSNNFGDFKVLKYNGTFDLLIEFLTTGYKCSVSLNNIKTGRVKDPTFPHVFGVACIGDGPYKSRPGDNQPQFKSYKVWKEIINRCYSSKCSSYPNYGGRGVKVCDGWLNYQNFAKWWEDNYVDDFVIDKDLIDKGSLIYSPETCCFIPVEINSALTNRRNHRGQYPIGVRVKDGAIIAQINDNGKKRHLGTFKTVEEAFDVYSKAKKESLKNYAEKWKEKLTDKAYNAIINYKIEITD
jgi:hypothetical protein